MLFQEIFIYFLISSSAHLSLSNKLFNICKSAYLLDICLLSISNFIALWSEKIQGVVFNFFELVEIVLCLKM